MGKGEASCPHLWVAGNPPQGSGEAERGRVWRFPDGNGRRCGRNREVPERERNMDGEPGVYRYCGDTEGLKRVP